MEVALDIERLAEVDVSLQLAEVDELQGPSLPESFQGLLESHAMCSARSRRRNTCQDLARREPKSEKVSINSKTFGCFTLLTLPTKLSAEPITSNELGRAPCGLDGVDWTLR